MPPETTEAPAQVPPQFHSDILSAYAFSGPELITQGYSAIPIMPGDKAPGCFNDGVWAPMKNWNRFCRKIPSSNLTEAWSRWPNAGVGVACGGGLVMVDIDLDDAVEAVVMALPATPVSKRGAKGLTLCFRGDTSRIKSRAFKSKDKIGLCDLLSDGKQSVMPPSIHPKTGLPYVYTTARTLLDTPLPELPELPDNVADLIGEALKPFGYEAEPERASIAIEPLTVGPGSGSTFRGLNDDALANLDAWVPALRLPKTRRKGAGFRAVSPWTVSGQGLPDARRAANLSLNPKGIVDFGDGGKPHTALDVVLLALGCDFDDATRWLGERLGRDFSPAQTIVAGYNSPSKRAEREAAEQVGDTKPVALEPSKAPAISATPFRLGDPKRLPKREWLYGTTLIRKFISVTVAPGGVGKSSLTIVEALAMVTGRPLLGVPVPNGPLRVWLWNGEDPLDELSRRFHAACLHHRVDEAAIGGRLFVNSGRDMGLVVMREVKKEVIAVEPVVEAVVTEIEAKKIDVMIVDPFVTTHEVSENDNMAMNRVAVLWQSIANRTGCAIMLVHHAKKMQGAEVNAEDARGASALNSAARMVRTLNGMTKDEADRYGIGSDEQSSYVRSGDANGKANLARRSSGNTWFKLVSVALGNGRGDLDPGDEVGVVESWVPPSVEAQSALSREEVEAVRVEISRGEHRLDERADRWVGHAVGRALALDLDPSEPKDRKRVRAHVKAVVKRLVDERHLAVVERPDAARKPRDFVVIGPGSED